MSWLDWVLAGIVVALVVCPAKFDPAIRWKERNEAKRDKK